MFNLTIVFGPNSHAIQFLFKERNRAESALEATKIDAQYVTVDDDFDQHGEFKAADIHARLIDSLSGSGDAMIERTLQNSKTQIKAQNRAGNDPLLKMAMNGLGGAPLNHPGAPPQRRFVG